MKQKLLLLSMLWLSYLVFDGKPVYPLSKREENPMERREEKLKVFREKRDQFFKEDPKSPLKESDRKKFKGLLYYPIDLKYAEIGSIERYPSEPKPIYASLPTTRGNEKKYVK